MEGICACQVGLGRKQFIFEKKNQKTFVCLGAAGIKVRRDGG
jgi:hypothetical protein